MSTEHAWSWTAHSDEEALGVQTILERAGLNVGREDDEEHRPILVVADEAEAERARKLEARVLDHYVRRSTRTVSASLVRRAVWSRRVLLIGAALLVAGLLLALR